MGLGEPSGLHAVTDRIDGIGRTDRPMLLLIISDDERQEVELVCFGRAGLRLRLEEWAMEASAAS
jgi:hypothetical protein